ncbi:hypothetical protein AKJ09_03701 [Labilithrix luteola]|uniref:Uncharacterized protein n=1 Tax=Labilithrix luteola TaxID=1391654 RepID=A0A0K1PU42_9BACT|nr:hypothetical protein AKJ09_03701 [Labilithrix luteola]
MSGLVQCVDCREFEDPETLYCGRCQVANCEASKVNGYRYGAAVAFGLMAMAEAIRDWPGLEACRACGRATSSQLYHLPREGVPTPPGYICIPCNETSKDFFR